MANIVVICILIILVGAAIRSIWKEKKKGTRCIGCSNAGYCSHRECKEK